MPKRKGNQFYRLKNRYRVHGYNKEGKWRILRWETVPEDIREYLPEEKKGMRRIIEWVINFIPTRSRGEPSSPRNWEVRLQLPDGYDEEDVKREAWEILADLTNEEMVATSRIDWTKKGTDVVEYVEEEYSRWKVVDRARPQYKYPKESEWKDI